MWDFRIRGYAGSKHPRARLGEFLGETTHKGISSAQMEIQVWQDRCTRGDASCCVLIDMRPGGQMTNLRVDATTKLDWK